MGCYLCTCTDTGPRARVCVSTEPKTRQNRTQNVVLTRYPHYGFPPSIGSVQSRPRALCPCTVGRGHRILSTIIWARLVAWVHELLLHHRSRASGRAFGVLGSQLGIRAFLSVVRCTSDDSLLCYNQDLQRCRTPPQYVEMFTCAPQARTHRSTVPFA